MRLEHSFTVPAPVDQAWQVLLDVERIAPCMPGATLEEVDGDEFTGNVKVKVGPINLTYKGTARFAEKDEAAHRAVIEGRGKDTRGNGTASAKVTANLEGKGDAETVVNVVTDLTVTGRPAQFGRGVMSDVGDKLIGRFADCLAARLGEGDAADDTGDSGGSGGSGASGEAAASGNGTAASGAPSGGTSGGTAAAPTAAAGGPAIASPAGAGAQASPATPAGSPSVSAGPSGTSETPGLASAGTGAAPGSGTASRPRPAHRMPAREAEPIDLFETAGPVVLKRLVPVGAGVAVLAVVIALIARRRRRR